MIDSSVGFKKTRHLLITFGCESLRLTAELRAAPAPSSVSLWFQNKQKKLKKKKSTVPNQRQSSDGNEWKMGGSVKQRVVRREEGGGALWGLE